MSSIVGYISSSLCWSSKPIKYIYCDSTETEEIEEEGGKTGKL
jgi:hypothetical protein